MQSEKPMKRMGIATKYTLVSLVDFSAVAVLVVLEVMLLSVV